MKRKRMIRCLVFMLLILPICSCSRNQRLSGAKNSGSEEEDRSGYIVFVNSDSPGRNIMYRIGASGGSAVRKKLFDKNTESPSGREGRIAFLAAEKNKKNLYAMNADGGGLVPVISDTDVKENSLSWSPDGKRLVFVSKMTGDAVEQVYVSEAAAASTPIRVTGSDIEKESPAFTTDGRSLFYCGTSDKNSDIYVADILRRSEVNLSQNTCSDISPVPMPDGTRLLFLSDESSAGKFNLYAMDVDGKGRSALTTEMNIDRGSVGISPDGGKVSFTAVDDSGNKSVRIINITGSNIMVSNDSYMSSWSEDGSKLYFASSDAQYRKIVQYDAESGDMKDIIKIEYKPGEDPSGIRFLHFTKEEQIE